MLSKDSVPLQKLKHMDGIFKNLVGTLLACAIIIFFVALFLGIGVGAAIVYSNKIESRHSIVPTMVIKGVDTTFIYKK